MRRLAVRLADRVAHQAIGQPSGHGESVPRSEADRGLAKMGRRLPDPGMAFHTAMLWTGDVARLIRGSQRPIEKDRLGGDNAVASMLKARSAQAGPRSW